MKPRPYKIQKYWRILLTLILIPSLVFLNSCAVLTHGTNQMIPVASAPQGAEVFVDGKFMGTTPTTVELSRANLHTIILKLGNLEREVLITSMTDGSSVALDVAPVGVGGLGVVLAFTCHDLECINVTAAGLLIGIPVFVAGITAVVVDASTGAWYELSPGEVFVDFEQPVETE